MTAKQKAIELLDRFLFLGLTLIQARYCALICVNEILEAIDWHDHETPNNEIEFWNEVKQEIEKL